MIRALVIAAVLLAAPAALAEDPPPPLGEPTATISISQVQVAFLLSGNVGGGTLRFEGKDYPFTVGGIGVGGIGASKIEATGKVYGLTEPSQIEGAYAQARYGAVAGEHDAGGALWMRNANGVSIELRSRREGYALSLGADGVYISLDE